MSVLGFNYSVLGDGAKAVGFPSVGQAASAPSAMTVDTNFTATDAGTGTTFVLTLIQAPVNNGAAIDYYQYRVGAGGTWTLITAWPFIVAGETVDGVASNVYVRAHNAAGFGGDGTPDSVTTSVSTTRTYEQVLSLYQNGSTGRGVQLSAQFTAGVDSLPAGASIAGDVITVTGDDITFSRWDFTGYRVSVDNGSTGCIFTQCKFAAIPNSTAWAGQFILLVNPGAVVAEVSWCTFKGAGTIGGEAALIKEQYSGNNGASTTAGKITLFANNSLVWLSNDAFKAASNGVIRDCYFGPMRHYDYVPPVWSSGATFNTGDVVRYTIHLFVSKSDGNTNHQPPGGKVSDTYWQVLDPHGDQLNPYMVLGTGKEVYGCYFNRGWEQRLDEDDATGYGYGMNSSFFFVRNNNALNVPMESIYAHHCIIGGGLDWVSGPINLGSAGSGAGSELWHPHTVINCWLQGNANGKIFYVDYSGTSHTVSPNTLDYVQANPV